MAVDQFCLRWNNFQINITSALESLKSDEDLVDVTLTCDGQNVKAHKVILSACSPYFRNVFKENPCQHPVVILKDVRYEDVQALLSFMYQGEVYISQDRLAPFLHTAELLQVRGLAGAANPFRETQQQQSPAPPPPTPPPPPAAAALQPQVTASHSKQRKPVSLPSVPPPVVPHLHTYTRPSVPSSPAFVTSEQPAIVSPELPVPVSVSPTLSQPSSPQHDDAPLPLSKRRKAFPRRFAAMSAPLQLSSQEEFPNLPHQTPAVANSPLHDLPVTIKKEPISQDEEEVQEEQTVRGMDGNGSPSASGASEDTDCFESNLGDEDSRGVPLKEEIGGPSPPASQQQSMLMRSLSGAPPQHTPVPDDVNRRQKRRSQWSMQPRPCHLCHRLFSNMGNLKQHIQNVHLPAQFITCPSCPKLFKNKRYLRKHLVLYHGAPHRRLCAHVGCMLCV